MNAAAAIKVSVADISKYIRNKSDLYEAALRNGFYLPKKNAQVITEEFLIDVLRGGAWCPKYTEIRLLPCPRPPCKETLLKKFEKMVKEKNLKNVVVDGLHQPDCRWLLDVLSTFAPQDEIFNKGYVGPPRKVKQQDVKSVELPAAVLFDLPPSTKKVKSRRLKIFGKGQVESKIERLKINQRQVGVALLEQQIKLERLQGKAVSKEEKKFPVVTAGADPLNAHEQQPSQAKPPHQSPSKPSSGKQGKVQGQVSTPMPQNPQSRNSSATRASGGGQDAEITDLSGNR